jgi:flagellar biosynthesis protein FlhG
MTDQATELRQLACDRRSHCDGAAAQLPLVIVAGGKGGVGTTSVAIRLARAFAKCGSRVTLVDADFPRCDATAWFTSQPQQGITDVIVGQASVADVVLQVTENLQLMPANRSPKDQSNNEHRTTHRLLDAMRQLSQRCEWIVADCGNNVSNLLAALYGAASDLLLVSTCDDIAVMDAYAALKQLHAASDDVVDNSAVHLLLNRGHGSKRAAIVHQRFSQTAQRFLDLEVRAAGYSDDFDLSSSNTIDRETIHCGHGALELAQSFLQRQRTVATEQEKR